MSMVHPPKATDFLSNYSQKAFLQFCGFTKEDLPYAAEINPYKYGRVTPGSNIPIISAMSQSL